MKKGTRLYMRSSHSEPGLPVMQSTRFLHRTLIFQDD